MLDVGFSEILLTSVIALVVLGPERLPKVARQVGNWMGRARAMARQLSEQLDREVSADELMKQQAKTAARPPPQAHPADTQSPSGATVESNASDVPVEPYTSTAAAVPVTPGAPEATHTPAPSAAEVSAVAADDTHWPDGILPASATTPAAMHAPDWMSVAPTPAADVPPIAAPTAPAASPATTTNPPHE
jgi:sec-independent protein translocase protein TatB